MIFTRSAFLRLSSCGVLAGAAPLPARAEILLDPRLILGRQGWLFAAWENLTDTDTEGTEKSLGLLRDAHGFFAARDITLLFLIVPMKARMEKQYLPDEKTMSRSVEERYGDLLKHVSNLGLTALDVRPTLIHAQAPDQSVFTRTDQHWTGRSAEACANLYASFIQEHWPALVKNHGGEFLGKWIVQRRYGDLAGFLPSTLREKIGMDAYIVRDSNIMEDESLYGDGTAALRVIGNSFARPYFGFPSALSHALRCPIGLATQRGDTGHWKVMLDFVESPKFAAHPPRCIVWELLESHMQFPPDSAGVWMTQSIMSPAAWRTRMKAALDVRRA